MTVPNDPAEFTAKIAKWKKTLANMTEIVLPTDYPRFIPHRIVETETSLDISEASSMAILQLSMQNKMVSPFTILLASFAILLHKYTNEQDISVGSSSASSNPLVLRLAISEEDSMIKVIENVLKV
jgi:L-2-aminoadipate reductase